MKDWVHALLLHIAILCLFALAYFVVSRRIAREHGDDIPSLETALYHSINMHFTLGLDVSLAGADQRMRRLTMAHTLVAFAAMLFTRKLFCLL